MNAPFPSSANAPDASPPLPFSVEQGKTLDADELSKYAPLASQILDDPVALRQVSDRVFELLCRDLRLQQERRQGYGR